MPTIVTGLTQAKVIAAFKSMRSSLPDSTVSVTYGNETGTGVKTNLESEPDLQSWGLLDDYEFSVRVLNSEFTTLEVNTRITVDSVEYLILDMDQDRTEATRRVHLGHKHA